jgi:hypothetical protein
MSDLENLITAAKLGDLERADSILETNSSLVNQKDASGATPTHITRRSAVIGQW